MKNCRLQIIHYISKIKILWILIAVLCCVFTHIYADFDDTGVGARPMGMGNAFISLADDVYALYYNPAGLGWLKRAEFATEYERLYMGLSDDSTIAGSFIGYVLPLQFYSHSQKKVDKSTHTYTVETVLIEKKHNFGVIGLGWINFGLVGVYQENIVSLAWGNRFKSRGSYGVTLKGLMQKYTQDAYTRIDPVFEMGKKASSTAFSFDVGFLYNFAPRLFAGLMIMDMNQPDIGFKSSEKLPMSIKTGICYRDKSLRLPLDIVKKDNDIKINGGAEKWFFKKTFALRGGSSLGSRNLRDISLGISWDFSVFRVDYGFRYPFSGIEETIGSHRVSLICRFGRPPEDELEPGSIEEELVKLEKERRELKAQLKDAVEMREKIEQVLIEEALARVREKIKAVKYYPSVKKKTVTKIGGQVFKTHIVSKGDTLKSLALRYFGAKKKWLDIYNLNKEKIGRGGSLKRGTVMLIPTEISIGEDMLKLKGIVSVEQKPKKQILPKPVKQARPAKKAPSAVKKRKVFPSKKFTQSKAFTKKEEEIIRKKTHTVKAGETIKSIAEKYYDKAARWKDIYKANKDKIKMGRVEEGVTLIIP